ncbi:MAG: hypothetical protein V4773_29330 [Verrucomicrobiota bacterium]
MKTKTALKLLALISTSALPAVAAAESFGLALPTALDASHILGAFVATFVALIAFSDYTRKPFSVARRAAVPVSSRKYVYPFAA